jgi:hypothetical protein
MPLEQELATFDRELPQLLKVMRGRYVLIHGDTVDGSWGTEDEAYEAGCEKFGLGPFLVMLVEENEKPIPVFQNVRPHADPTGPA